MKRRWGKCRPQPALRWSAIRTELGSACSKIRERQGTRSKTVVGERSGASETESAVQADRVPYAFRKNTAYGLVRIVADSDVGPNRVRQHVTSKVAKPLTR